MTRAEALCRIKTLRDEINANSDADDVGWSNNVAWYLDMAGDVIEFPDKPIPQCDLDRMN